MLYGIKALLVVLVSIPTAFLILCLAAFDRDGKFVYRFSRVWSWAILKIGGIRIKILGLERLDPKRAYVFISNHQSNIDILVLIHSLAQFQLRWMAKRELLRIPLFGLAMWASRHIIVDRSDRAKAMASLRRARERIKSGLSVVFFPEGTRSSDGELLPFKKGAFVLAVKSRTPIVPITIKGSGALLPRGEWRLRGGKVEVIVSQPIPLDRPYPGRLGNLLRHVREIIESQSRQNGGFNAEGSKEVRTLAAEASPEQS